MPFVSKLRRETFDPDGCVCAVTERAGREDFDVMELLLPRLRELTLSTTTAAFQHDLAPL
jgi:hypothetical protein